MKAIFSSILTFLMIFSHDMFGLYNRGVPMGSSQAPFAFKSKSDLDNWYEITPRLADHLKRFPEANIPVGEENQWASFAAQQSIDEDQDDGLRPLLSCQENDTAEQAQKRYGDFLKICNFRQKMLLDAYLKNRNKK
jgi:hypothetical protein